MIQRTVLFLKFALVFGRFQSYLYGMERAIKLPLTVRLFKVCGFKRSYKSQISTIVDSSRKARGCPGLGRGFSVLCVNANFMKLQSRVIIRIATILKHNPITLLIQKYLTD